MFLPAVPAEVVVDALVLEDRLTKVEIGFPVPEQYGDELKPPGQLPPMIGLVTGEHVIVDFPNGHVLEDAAV